MRRDWDVYPFGGVLVLSLLGFFTPGSDLPSGPPVSDKLEHAAIFFALALTGRYAGFAVSRLVVGLCCYAAVTEVLQAVLPIGRDGDWRDVVADVLGVAAAVLLTRAGAALLRLRRARRGGTRPCRGPG
ncbi:MAG TPA: VanZ family protein [Marmoricola sp.]|jgi:VanZ family protein|nr:VanZ family protein [Marmoricola sp.]